MPFHRAPPARLLMWTRAGGARWNGIEFHVDADANVTGRAFRALAPGEQILALPRRLMIADNELASSTTGQLALGLEAPRPRDALAAWLPLEVKQPMSRWKPYLDALPDRLDELPMFREDGELTALAGTAAHALTTVVSRDIADTYERLAPELRARITLADFSWGCAIVRSRAFHAPGTTEERIALLPLVDLFNHGLGDTTWTFEPRDAAFVVTTERPFAPGEEVHFTYAECSNTRLLVDYGFTLPANVNNEAHLLFEQPGEPVVRMRVACVVDHRFSRALSLARLLAASTAERARAQQLGLDDEGEYPSLGPAHEEAAFTILAEAARRALAENDAHLPSPGETWWARNCQTVRDSERAVLVQLVELTTLVRDHLHATPEQVRAFAATIPADATGARRMLRQYLDAL